MTDKSTITLTVTIDIPLERAINAIVGGLEGGYSPWMHAFKPDETDEASRAALAAVRDRPDRSIWYSMDDFWRLGGRALMRFDGKDEEEGEGNTIETIDLLRLSLAMNRMNKVAPAHFADLVAENDDAVTHDVFMQLLVFEEIIYG